MFLLHETDRAASRLPASEPLDRPGADDIEMTAVTPHGWRVVDRRMPVGHPFRLLAYIDLRGEVFEVMQVGTRFQWHGFGVLSEAIEFVLATGPDLARDRVRGELAWIR